MDEPLSFTAEKRPKEKNAKMFAAKMFWAGFFTGAVLLTSFLGIGQFSTNFLDPVIFEKLRDFWIHIPWINWFIILLCVSVYMIIIKRRIDKNG